MQQSKTITNMEKHEQEEPTKTIANMTAPMGTTQEQRNKYYETFGGGVMLMECGTK